MTRLLTTVPVVVLLWAGSARAQEPTRERITMLRGTSKVLTVRGMQRVAVGNDEVADVKTLGKDQLLLTATADGPTSLIVWTAGGKRVEYDIVVGARLPPTGGAAVDEPSTPLELFVGMQKVLTVPNIQRVAVGDVEVMDVKTIGNSQLLLVGMNPGVTTLIVWRAGGKRSSYTVTVKAHAPAEAGDGAAPGAADSGGTLVGPVRDVTPPISETLALRVGASLRRAVPGLRRIAVGDADIADISVDGAALDVKGVAPGRTMVLLWLKGGQRLAWRVEVSAP